VTSALIGVLRDGLALALLIAAPVLVAALIAGVLTGLIGVLTQLDDPAIGLAARVAAIAIAIVIFTPAIARELAELGTHVGAMIGQLGAG
jgi:type III secretory pathway component EscS